MASTKKPSSRGVILEQEAETRVVKSGSTNGITPEKYAKAWDMFYTGSTAAAIMTAVGLSRPQMEWLVRVGDPKKDMPSFASRSGEIMIKLKARDQEIAEVISEGAVEWARRRTELAIQSTKLAIGITSALGAIIAEPAAKLAIGQATGEDIARLKSTVALRDTLKALAPLTEFASVTELTQSVLNQDRAASLTKEARENLSPESTMPANIALIEGVLGPTEASHDPIIDLIPEWTHWTDEERSHYVATGEPPRRQIAGTYREK